MKSKQKSLRYLLFVNLFSMAGYYTFTPLYALFAHSFSISPKEISFIWGCYSLLTACFILLFGKLENRRRKGKSVVIGYFLCSIAALLLLTVHDEKSLMLVLAANAFAAGMTMPAYKALFSRVETKGRESEQWAWSDAGTMFAAAGGGALSGIVIGAFGFHGIFIAMAAIQFTAALVAYRALYSLK